MIRATFPSRFQADLTFVCLAVTLRIQLGNGPKIQRRNGKNRHVAYTVGALLKPALLLIYALGLWKVASDLKLATEFAMDGPFGHWQVWMGVGAVLQVVSFGLNRYGMGQDFHIPEILWPKIVPVEKVEPETEAVTEAVKEAPKPKLVETSRPPRTRPVPAPVAGLGAVSGRDVRREFALEVARVRRAAAAAASGGTRRAG